MRRLWMMLALALLSGPALAEGPPPAEPPPRDFPARQYIDSRGCVFARDDAGRWLARLARDGTPICGYPPSLSVRGLNGRPRLRALDPDAGRSRADLLRQALSETVITNLRPGELASDPRRMEELPDLGPEPASSAPAEALKAAVAAAPAIRQEMAGALQPNRRLCALLGHDGRPVAGGDGHDPSRGYCASLSEMDLARLSFSRPLVDPVAALAPDPVRASPPAGTDRAAPPKAADRPSAPPVRGKRARLPAPIGMIPAGARYVQLGMFADPAEAARVSRAAMQLGYRVSRGRGIRGGRSVELILAGPFDDRETIVRALDALRRAGHAGAVPR